MSNEFTAPSPVMPFVAESSSTAAPHAHHHNTAKETKPLPEVSYAPAVFKGPGHKKIEKELARTLDQLPYMDNTKPAKGTATKTDTRPLWKKALSTGIGAAVSILSPTPTPLGLSFTAASTTYKYARNVDGVKATEAALRQLAEAGTHGTVTHVPDNDKQPNPIALMGRTRLLRSRHGHQRGVKTEVTFPIDPPENQNASHAAKVIAGSSTNGSGQSR